MKPEEHLLEIKDMLFRLAHRILGNKQDAEDAVTDFYLRVCERSDRFQQYENIKGALVSGLRNHCLNVLKSNKRRSLERETLPDNPDSAKEDDEQTMEKFKLVQGIINGLPEKQKTLIHLRMVEGLSMKEIAEIIGEKVNTVEVAISRIRKTIRKSYEEQV